MFYGVASEEERMDGIDGPYRVGSSGTDLLVFDCQCRVVHYICLFFVSRSSVFDV